MEEENSASIGDVDRFAVVSCPLSDCSENPELMESCYFSRSRL